MKKKLTLNVAACLAVSVLVSCSGLGHLEKNLSPDHQDFLSKVRYIITKQERKIFLKLPPSDRNAFIEEFWKRRDSDPDTEINEFKEAYLNRIEEANHLFKEGGTPGWLQDRGRIYILLGPPEGREKYPTGYTFYGRPIEVWYYGPYPIMFIDRSYVGDYELVPQSAQYAAQLLKAMVDLKPDVQLEEGGGLFDFDLNLKKFPENKIQVQINVPYENIWLAENEGKLETTLILDLEVITDKKEKVWVYSQDYPISMEPDQMKKTLGQSYEIKVDAQLPEGSYRMKIRLENKTDEKGVQKSITFKL